MLCFFSQLNVYKNLTTYDTCKKGAAYLKIFTQNGEYMKWIELKEKRRNKRPRTKTWHIKLHESNAIEFLSSVC